MMEGYGMMGGGYVMMTFLLLIIGFIIIGAYQDHIVNKRLRTLENEVFDSKPERDSRFFRKI